VLLIFLRPAGFHWQACALDFVGLPVKTSRPTKSTPPAIACRRGVPTIAEGPTGVLTTVNFVLPLLFGRTKKTGPAPQKEQSDIKLLHKRESAEQIVQKHRQTTGKNILSAVSGDHNVDRDASITARRNKKVPRRDSNHIPGTKRCKKCHFIFFWSSYDFTYTKGKILNI